MHDRVRRVAVVSVTSMLTFVTAACTGDGGDAPAEGAAAAEARFAVSLTEFAITPKVIHAPVGRSLTFEVTNDGSAIHTFDVDAGGTLQETPEIQPGQHAVARPQARGIPAGSFPGHELQERTGLHSSLLLPLRIGRPSSFMRGSGPIPEEPASEGPNHEHGDTTSPFRRFDRATGRPSPPCALATPDCRLGSTRGAGDLVRPDRGRDQERLR
jgi:hypothetical protein